jgi:hypothetical protein
MTKQSDEDSRPADNKPTAVATGRKTTPLLDPYDGSFWEYLSGIFRGFAAATRKAVMANSTAAKGAIRAVGEARPLAFASEGAVAGDAIIPRWAYYGAWGLSGLAIGADIYNKYDEAPAPIKSNTVLYWTAFHVPASLVVPAVIIHRVVHLAEGVVQNPKGIAGSLPPRARALAPVAAAMLSIIPVVPTVDHAAEAIMEPTLGRYLGLEFHRHRHSHDEDSALKEKEA